MISNTDNFSESFRETVDKIPTNFIFKDMKMHCVETCLFLLYSIPNHHRSCPWHSTVTSAGPGPSSPTGVQVSLPHWAKERPPIREGYQHTTQVTDNLPLLLRLSSRGSYHHHLPSPGSWLHGMAFQLFHSLTIMTAQVTQPLHLHTSSVRWRQRLYLPHQIG